MGNSQRSYRTCLEQETSCACQWLWQHHPIISVLKLEAKGLFIIELLLSYFSLSGIRWIRNWYVITDCTSWCPFIIWCPHGAFSWRRIRWSRHRSKWNRQEIWLGCVHFCSQIDTWMNISNSIWKQTLRCYRTNKYLLLKVKFRGCMYQFNVQLQSHFFAQFTQALQALPLNTFKAWNPDICVNIICSINSFLNQIILIILIFIIFKTKKLYNYFS